MNFDESKKVLEIMTAADYGCSTCAQRLFTDFLIEFPECLNIAQEVWSEKFPDEHQNFRESVEDEIKSRKFDLAFDNKED